jgi:rhodanese-related sulfurtransferase
MKIEGARVDLADLLKKEYVGSTDGSSLTELQTAARDRGLSAGVFSHLDSAALRRIAQPVVLHVKNEFDAPRYNHFVLCVRGRDGACIIYDAPAPARRIAWHELDPIWGGSAMVVSAEPVAATQFTAAEQFRVACSVGAVAAGVLMARRFRRQGIDGGSVSGAAGTERPRRWLHSPVAQCAALVLTAAALGGVYHGVYDGGFFAQWNAVAAISAERLKRPASVPTIDVDKAAAMFRAGATFVDARKPGDFNLGHIPRAVNLPPDSGRWVRTATMSGMAKDKPIVVYCQNTTCPYAEFVARKLAADDFATVNIFPGGWEEWAAARVD